MLLGMGCERCEWVMQIRMCRLLPAIDGFDAPEWSR